MIAHYNEKLDWLAPIASHAHVYHKGTDLQAPPSLKLFAREKLPNVGRESHTYLYHIVNNYETLSGVTVFLQGEGVGKFCFDTPEDYLTNLITKNVACKSTGPSSDWGRSNHRSKWQDDLEGGKMRRSKWSLGEFFQELFGFPHPPTFNFCPTGCFAATRDMIKKHPVEFYKKAISYIDDHPNPEEGHYFERLWPTIICGC